MRPSMIIVLTFLLNGFLIWHGIFINNLSRLIASKELDHKFIGLPTYEYFYDLQYSLPYNVCKIKVWDNCIKFCSFSYGVDNTICSKIDIPQELVWIDPYHYFVPLQMYVC